MILFLDYDGVLHAEDVYRTKRGIALRSAGTLFEHAEILVAALEPHPHVQIVLSTSWVREVGFNKAKKRLPTTLQNRVIGATYYSTFDNYDNHIRDIYTRGDNTRSQWQIMTRYAQIAQYVLRHGVEDWLAIDNDDHGWPKDQSHRLILTDDLLGLGEGAAQRRLSAALSEREKPKC